MSKLAGYFPYGAIASCIGSEYQIGPSIAHGFAFLVWNEFPKGVFWDCWPKAF